MKLNITFFAITIVSTMVAAIQTGNLNVIANTANKRSDTDLADMQEASDRLTKVFKDIRGHVDEIGFDFKRFEQNLDQYRKHIADVSFRVANAPKLDDMLEYKLKAVKNLYSKMVDSADQMVLYSQNTFPGSEVLSGMLSLQVRTLSFYDIKGHFDSQMENFEEKLAALLGRLDCLKEDAKGYLEVPEFKRVSLDLLSKTESPLTSLWAYHSKYAFADSEDRVG